MREVFRFIYSADFEEERGNPVKEDLASFEGVSLHCAIDIADRCLGLSIAAFPECLLQGEPWLTPILKSHLPLLGFNPLCPKSRESVLGRGFIDPLSSSPGVGLGKSQLHVQVGYLFFFSECSRYVGMNLRGRFPL